MYVTMQQLESFRQDIMYEMNSKQQNAPPVENNQAISVGNLQDIMFPVGSVFTTFTQSADVPPKLPGTWSKCHAVAATFGDVGTLIFWRRTA